jgi:hypothetical protein
MLNFFKTPIRNGCLEVHMFSAEETYTWIYMQTQLSSDFDNRILIYYREKRSCMKELGE